MEKRESTNAPARLWIYCDPRYLRELCGPVFDASVFRGHGGAVGTFIGCFHWLPALFGRRETVPYLATDTPTLAPSVGKFAAAL